jgi:hypothetical protein
MALALRLRPCPDAEASGGAVMSDFQTRVVVEWYDECAKCGNHQLPPEGEVGYFRGDEPLCGICAREMPEEGE